MRIFRSLFLAAEVVRREVGGVTDRGGEALKARTGLLIPRGSRDF